MKSANRIKPTATAAAIPARSCRKRLQPGPLKAAHRTRVRFGYPHPGTPVRPTARTPPLGDPAGVSKSTYKRKLLAIIVGSIPVVVAIVVALSASSHGG